MRACIFVCRHIVSRYVRANKKPKSNEKNSNKNVTERRTMQG
jgi:hypothetical protein